jgi:hypothetical protein
MKKNYNIEEEGFKEVRNLLKNLPHISAPHDFDNELKRKLITLQNKRQKKSIFVFPFRRALIPAAAFGLTSIILFFILTGRDDQNINPFFLSPEQKIQSGLNINSSSPIKVNSNDVVINENKTGITTNESQMEKEDISSFENNNSYRQRIKELLVNSDYNNVDRSLKAKPESSSMNNSRGSTVNFNGFNIIQEDDQVIDELRDRMDSIKQYMKENKKK